MAKKSAAKKTNRKKAAKRKTKGTGRNTRGASRTSLPYLNAYGNISKVLERIRTAATPERFTQDFLSTKLGLTGGGARPLIPFLKRIGFLSSDGSPTELYTRFRNASEAGRAAAAALRKGYSMLYEMNEYAHELSDANLRGLIVQATGLDATANSVRAIAHSFNALKAVADFGATGEVESTDVPVETDVTSSSVPLGTAQIPSGVNLGYTINLHLPATSDVAVFNAVFRSLREHILKG